MKAFLFTTQNARTELNDYFLIGSDESCHWISAAASNRHAKIELHQNQFLLKDLRSESGTYLNDQKIQEAYLQEGDWIRIGEEEKMFSFQAEKDQPTFLLKSKNQDWNHKLQRLGTAAATDFSILILGPSGSGKEVIAQAIHKGSKRSKGPIVSVNCSALSENLVESELFGHLKGSFTGALGDRKGAFESARGGTLFLDEIGDLSLNLQAKLLRALENNEIRPVGSDSNIRTDVRVVAATHQNLIEKIQNQEFRSDLYYRLNVLSIETPTLFDRPEDFEELLYTFAKQMKVRFSFSGIERMKKHSWPGNIRELKNTVARAAAMYPRETIYEEQVETILDKLSLGPKSQPIANSLVTPLPVIKEMERQMILKRLASNNGNQRQTALDLGLPKSTLHDRLRAYNIDPRTYSKSSVRMRFQKPASM